MARVTIGLAAMALMLLAPSAVAAPYTPVSQVLEYCKVKQPFEAGVCFGYINGALEVATIDQPGPTSSEYLTSLDTPMEQMIKRVVTYLEAVPREDASSPAAPAILRALRRRTSTDKDS